MLNITREELREDIREALKETQETIITMVNEDLMALRKDMKNMERRLGRKIDSAIAAHNRNPYAHRPSS